MTAPLASDWGATSAALAKHGYASLLNAMPEASWQGLRAEAGRLFDDDAFSAAGVGRGDDVRTESATRGGSVCWLDVGAGMPAGDAFMAWMEGLRVALNRSLFLGLDGFEAQYAHYPIGASYGTHVDRHHARPDARDHRDKDARVVSVVIYLNADWPLDAGGDLVIYDALDVPVLTLAPKGGTLVLFMSEDTPHEAKRSTRERWSLAGWFRTRR
ncbi:MAG TPA: 2OG-Fe(II) oxygenase [Polyangia bacterium]|jgi:SM-20-related protein|nr:2OG-Fe(II) oxygenase [Polyangia bacterium]